MQRQKHLQGFENLAGVGDFCNPVRVQNSDRVVYKARCFENDASLLAPGGAASFADGVRQQRYSGSREESCGKDRSCAPNELSKKLRHIKNLS